MKNNQGVICSQEPGTIAGTMGTGHKECSRFCSLFYPVLWEHIERLLARLYRVFLVPVPMFPVFCIYHPLYIFRGLHE